ncbi:glycosyl hydrolase family 18 protein [Cupriavidus sp. UME77]|uniref:glycosyl hydrolase family 18 protein n=1 Tax=Cupriavidus sp. UME77 TaxID=1862321 RepID=UPI0027146B6C|nr:glycosyl hydrolase family 18 protein [Cupriavidus sp. UME77]
MHLSLQTLIFNARMATKLKFNQLNPDAKTGRNSQGRTHTVAYAAIAAASSLCLVNAAFAAPGTPSLKAYEITSQPHGFVEIDLQKAGGAAPYKDIVKLNKKVEVPLPFDIWSNGTAVKAVAVVDGVVDQSSETKLTPGGTQSGQVLANVKTPGIKKMQVRVFDATGASTDSAPLDVMVFDTVPELADDLPNNADKTNKPFANKSGSVVGSYYTTWSIYARDFTVDKVPVENLTHILYGFVPICGANINESLRPSGLPYQSLLKACQGLPDYSVAIHDPWAEIAKTLPGQTAKSPLKGVLGQMMAAKKRNPDLKILPSIGGWTLSDPFYGMHDTAKRKVFVDSVEQLMRTWKFFDGVDIDWEFPGGNGANPSLGNKATDGQLYVTLMKELRQMLDRVSKDTGKTYQLTSAIGSPADKVAMVDYKNATQYMNYLFDMTYDYYGAWSMEDLGHQTALFAPKSRPDIAYTTANSVKALLAQGVDPKKLVIGAAMYGRGWTGVSGYTDNDPFTGKAKGPHAGQWEKGILDYKKIASTMVGPNNTGINGYEYHYDQTAEAPYVFNKSTGDLVTFDDARSVNAKGEYVRAHQLGGLFSWEIDADNGDILNAMHKGLGHDDNGGSVANRPPIANAGTGMTVTGPRTVSLDASKSRDPEGGNLTFKWEQIQGDPLKIGNVTSAKATVDVPEVKQDTAYKFRVTVKDPGGLTGTDEVIVTAKAKDTVEPPPGENRPPVAQLTGPTVTEAGQAVMLSAEKSADPDGTKLTFSWTVPSGITANATGAKLSFTAPELSKDQSFTFTVKVSDGKLSSTATHTVLVKAKQVSGGEGGAGGGSTGGGTGGGKYPAYKAGTQYQPGDTVSNLGKLYQCKPFPNSGWCSGAPSAYEPGKGFAWNDAWTLRGDDGNSAGSGGNGASGGSGGASGGNGAGGSTGGEAGNEHAQYKEGTKYNAGDVVANNGKLYRCKPFPYTNWCSMAAWAYEPGKGTAWEQAWEVHKK